MSRNSLLAAALALARARVSCAIVRHGQVCPGSYQLALRLEARSGSPASRDPADPGVGGAGVGTGCA